MKKVTMVWLLEWVQSWQVGKSDCGFCGHRTYYLNQLRISKVNSSFISVQLTEIAGGDGFCTSWNGVIKFPVAQTNEFKSLVIQRKFSLQNSCNRTHQNSNFIVAKWPSFSPTPQKCQLFQAVHPYFSAWHQELRLRH